MSNDEQIVDRIIKIGEKLTDGIENVLTSWGTHITNSSKARVKFTDVGVWSISTIVGVAAAVVLSITFGWLAHHFMDLWKKRKNSY